MDRGLFGERLRAASACVVGFAREYVRQELPDEVAFRVYPNQSCDDKPRRGDEVVFPADSLPMGEFLGPWSVEEVIECLWRDGKVPEWIDAAVEAVNERQSIVGLHCCGRFTASQELLYYQSGDVAPFGLKSPAWPPGWESVEVSGRFDLHWRLQKYKKNSWWRSW